MNQPDFPAAHSMDTEWYAVDRDGHVGYFSTGEVGRAPNTALPNDDSEMLSLSDLLFTYAEQAGLEYYVDDLISAPGGPVFDYARLSHQFETASFSAFGSCYSALLLLQDESLFTTGTPTRTSILQRFRRRQSNEPPAVQRVRNSKHILGYIAGAVSVSLLQQWVNSGQVIRAWVNHGLSATRIGMYGYSHDRGFKNWISGPYVRDQVPTDPLRLEQLPEQVQQLIARTRFPNSRFQRDRAIDPGEAGPCSGWESSWVSLDGLVHRDEDAEDE